MYTILVTYVYVAAEMVDYDYTSYHSLLHAAVRNESYEPPVYGEQQYNVLLLIT